MYDPLRSLAFIIAHLTSHGHAEAASHVRWGFLGANILFRKWMEDFFPPSSLTTLSIACEWLHPPLFFQTSLLLVDSITSMR